MTASRPIDERLIKALAHPLRWHLLEILTERGEGSPVELARLLDQPLATVSHHVRVLRDHHSIELVRTEPRRGAVEHYYRALMPAFFDEEQWKQIPVALRRGLVGQVLHRVVAEAAAAGTAGAFDAPASHLDRMIVELDDAGWRELSELLSGVLEQAQAIQQRSDERRGDEGAARSAELSILLFEVAESIARNAGAEDAASPPRRSPPVR
jgi:DNA-binding transcriptional ArsR family regulator